MNDSFSKVLRDISNFDDIKRYRNVEGSCGPLTLLASCELFDKGFTDFTVHHRFGFIYKGLERAHFFIERNFMVFDFSGAQFGLEGNPHVASLHRYESMFPIKVAEYNIFSEEHIKVLHKSTTGYLLS